MTDRNQQMYDDFQLVYNNLASNLAPGLDIFEISMYLTKAYYSFVNSAYQQYEKSEAARKSLIELVTTVELSQTTPTAGQEICKDSVFFKLPDNVLYIVYEAITAKKGKCFEGRIVQVTPVTHDDFHQVFNNPYKYNKNHALRLDIAHRGADRIAEVVYLNGNIDKYKIRYIRKPKPIILDDLGTDQILDPTTGQGISSATECELNPIYDQDIVRLAAQLAFKDYKAA